MLAAQRARLGQLTGDGFGGDIKFVPGAEISALLPRTASAYSAFALFAAIVDGDVVAEEEPWEAVYISLLMDLRTGADVSGYTGPALQSCSEGRRDGARPARRSTFKGAFLDEDEDWGAIETWTHDPDLLAPLHRRLLPERRRHAENPRRPRGAPREPADLHHAVQADAVSCR